MSILKSTNSGAQKRLMLDYLKENGYTMNGLLHIHSFYFPKVEENVAVAKCEDNIEIDWEGSVENPNDYYLIGTLKSDFLGADGVTYTLKYHIQLDTIEDFLIYRRALLDGFYDDKMNIIETVKNKLLSKPTTYSTVNTKQ